MEGWGLGDAGVAWGRLSITSGDGLANHHMKRASVRVGIKFGPTHSYWLVREIALCMRLLTARK